MISFEEFKSYEEFEYAVDAAGIFNKDLLADLSMRAIATCMFKKDEISCGERYKIAALAHEVSMHAASLLRA